MNFSKIDYSTLEIYPKGEEPSNEEIINDNSQWVIVAKKILEENQDILDGDLTLFIDKIKKIFTENIEIVKNHLRQNHDEEVIKEFEECFIGDNLIVKISVFNQKYNIDKENSDIISLLLNIVTITDFVINYIDEPSNMNISKFTV